MIGCIVTTLPVLCVGFCIEKGLIIFHGVNIQQIVQKCIRGVIRRHDDQITTEKYEKAFLGEKLKVKSKEGR